LTISYLQQFKPSQTNSNNFKQLLNAGQFVAPPEVAEAGTTTNSTFYFQLKLPFLGGFSWQ
jgi:hypothetical protein